MLGITTIWYKMNVATQGLLLIRTLPIENKINVRFRVFMNAIT